jgi:hypothetical protein
MSLSRVLRSAGFGASCLLLALGVMPAAAAAQANLSTQGFGYPTGQLSARADATAGAVGEVDPLSAVNPASIAFIGDQLLFFEAQPEFRSVTSAAGSDRTNLSRFPLVFGALPMGSRWVFSIGSSTLLDRTSASSIVGTQIVGADTVGMTTDLKITGAINDVRLAAGVSAAPWLQLGVGVHAITGRNLVTLGQSFTDTSTFSDFSQQRQLSYSGGALSAGAIASGFGFRVAGSFRYGGAMRVEAQDTVLGRGHVPNMVGLSLAYSGIKNSTLAVRTSHEGWSSMAGMGTASLGVHDTWDTSVGADVAGPNVAGHVLQLRAGVRSRDLPFDAAGKQVTERSVAAGFGSGWAGGHVITDLSLARANRTGVAGTSEKAWIVTIGLTLRP